MGAKGIRYGQGLKVVPLYAAAPTATFASKFVNCKAAHWATFLANWGTLDSAVVVTMEQATAAATTSSTPLAIKFWYRKLPAVGTDDTTITSASYSASTGVTLTASTDNSKALIIDVDPATLTEGYKFVRLVGTIGTAITGTGFMVNAILEPRYPSAVMASAS